MFVKLFVLVFAKDAANLWKVVCIAKKISKKNIKNTYFMYDSSFLVPFYARKCLLLHSKRENQHFCTLHPNKK